MQGKRLEAGLCKRMNEFGSGMDLITTLSSPKIPFHPPYDFTWVGSMTLNTAERACWQLFLKVCTRSQKKLLKSWRRDPLHMCRYHLNSIKTYGIKNILSRAEQQSEYAQVFCVGGGWDESGEWQMASITSHWSYGNKADLQNLGITFLILNSYLNFNTFPPMSVVRTFTWHHH